MIEVLSQDAGADAAGVPDRPQVSDLLSAVDVAMPFSVNPITLTLARSGDAGADRESLVRRAVALAVAEDLGEPTRHDITTEAVVDASATAIGVLRLKQSAVVAGFAEFSAVCTSLDPAIRVTPLVPEGAEPSDVPLDIARVEGPAAPILAAERVALNLAQRMSAIATATRRAVELARPFGIAILDTRKTTPGLRAFEKRAVAIGGGQNHRFGLFDGILIKDNHVRLAGGTREAIMRAKRARPDAPIEVEVTTLEELDLALGTGVEAVLLDNMTPALIRNAVELAAGRCYIEVSGGITLETLVGFLVPGVDAISLGALTHSAGHVDMSFEIEEFVC